MTMLSASCAAITKLSLDDAVAADIREGNGIYIIAQLLLTVPPDHDHVVDVENLQVCTRVNVIGTCTRTYNHRRMLFEPFGFCSALNAIGLSLNGKFSKLRSDLWFYHSILVRYYTFSH